MRPNLRKLPVSKKSDIKVNSAQHQDIAELVQRVRQGDLGGFDELVRRFQRQATAIAYRLLNNVDDAKEVTQDAFLRAFDRLETLSDPQRFASWFFRILSNAALNRRRSRALRRMHSLDGDASDDTDDAPRVLGDPHAATPLEEASGKDLERRIFSAIDELPEMQRQALVLFSIEKLPQKQVAEILNCSVEAVKWHVFTARKKLRETLADYL